VTFAYVKLNPKMREEPLRFVSKRDCSGCDFGVSVARDVALCSLAVRYRVYLMSLFAGSQNTFAVLYRWTQ
jgi:hypothetical protein